MGVIKKITILTNGTNKENEIAIEYITGEIKNNFRASIFTSLGNSLACNDGR